MKKLWILSTTLIIVLFSLNPVLSQEKYAVIITGDYAATNGTWAIVNGEGRSAMEEFWNDTYMMWELLHDMGYSYDNIYVLFANGEDYTFTGQDIRYKAANHDQNYVTDLAATKGNVLEVLTGLADGSNDYPILTEDDFLYIFTFDHGYYTTGVGWDLGVRHTLLCLMDYDWTTPVEGWDEAHSIADFEMQALLGNINAGKKLVVMQQCYSGGFIPYLEDPNTIICTAASALRAANTTDQYYYDSIDYPGDPDPGTEYAVESEDEAYVENGHEYVHGEFDLHLLNSLSGKTPDGFVSYIVPDYQDFPLSDADLNQDNIVSISETFQWVLDFDSRMRAPLISGKDYDDPQLSSPNGLAEYTSLEYPTIMFENIGPLGGLSVEHRGIIGITKDVHIESTNQLTFLNDADVYLLNDAKLIVDAGATLVLEDNVSIIATNENNELQVYGDLQVGDNITFSAESENLFELMIENPALYVSFDNSTFQNTIINCESKSLSMFSSDLTFSNVQQTTGDLRIFLSTLSNSSIEAVNIAPNTENTFISAFNTFTDGFPKTNAIVKVEGYSNYDIADNSIQNDILTSGLFYGILVSNSSDRTHFHIIENSTFGFHNSFYINNIILTNKRKNVA